MCSMILFCNWVSEVGELLPSFMAKPDPGFGGGGSVFSGAPGPSGPTGSLVCSLHS